MAQNKITRKDLTIYKSYNGFINISCVIGGYTFKQRYLYYTQKDAIKKFLEIANRANAYGRYWVYKNEFAGC